MKSFWKRNTGKGIQRATKQKPRLASQTTSFQSFRRASDLVGQFSTEDLLGGHLGNSLWVSSVGALSNLALLHCKLLLGSKAAGSFDDSCRKDMLSNEVLSLQDWATHRTSLFRLRAAKIGPKQRGQAGVLRGFFIWI